MPDRKYDLNGIYSVYKSNQGAPDIRKRFFDAVTKPPFNISKKYAETVYYKFRHGYVPKAQAPVQAQAPALRPEAPAHESEQAPTVEVTEITPEQVSVTQEVAKSEAPELQTKYRDMGKMFEEQNPLPGIPSEATDENTGGDESGQETETSGGPSGTGTGPKFNIALGKMLKLLAVTVDDNLLFSERKLSEYEKSEIEEVSQDLEAEYSKNLESEYAPWINYLVVSFVLPSVARIDILQKKAQDLMDYVKNRSAKKPFDFGPPESKEKPKPEPAAPVLLKEVEPKQEDVEAGKVELDMSVHSAQVQQWLKSLLDMGYAVSPDYRSSDMRGLDVDAFRRKVVRNNGDNFGGIS